MISIQWFRYDKNVESKIHVIHDSTKTLCGKQVPSPQTHFRETLEIGKAKITCKVCNYNLYGLRQQLRRMGK